MTVPNLAVAEGFYSDFGLDVQHAGGRQQLRTFGNPQLWGELVQAQAPKRLQYMRFGIYAEGTT